MPDAGQFVSVPIFKVLDTRSGIGESSAHKLAAAATIAVTVTGADGVPAGAAAVVANINVINATTAGYLTAWNTDSGDQGVETVGIRAGVNTSQTETIPVSASGTVSLTSYQTNSVDVAVTITGYYTGTGTAVAGDTYTGVPWTEIADSTTGLGVADAQIPASGSITVQAAGHGGIAAGSPVAVLQVNAMNASQSGYLTAYSAQSSDPGLAVLSYGTGMIYRNLVYAPLSSAGSVTITNHGFGPVDITVYSRGYFMPPAASPAGAEYWPIDPDLVYNTLSGAQLPANGSVTFQVADGDTISSGATGVAEDVFVVGPTAKGAVETGTSGAMHAAASFLAGDTVDVGYDSGLVTQVSPAGQETITNDSSAGIRVGIAVVGYFMAPHQPAPPKSVTASVSGQNATVSWAAPDTDGGSPVVSYKVTTSPDNATATVGPTTYQATLTGLSHASGDTFSVTATTAEGTSDLAASGPSTQTLTGTVRAASGAPMAGAAVTIDAADPPSWDDTSWTPPQIGTTTTDANGNWSFTVPPYASLPADAKAAASNNGGYLDVDAAAGGTAIVGGTTYEEAAFGGGAAWVGTGTQTPAPVTTPPAASVMTMQPLDVTDETALDTPANEAAASASQNDPLKTDASSNFIGNAANAYVAPLTDAYGYQEIGGNGSYNPYIAADGTNLANVAVTPNAPAAPPICDWTGPATDVQDGWAWTTVGEQHAYRDATGYLTYTSGSTTTLSVMESVNGGDYSFSYNSRYTAGSSFSTGIVKGPKASYLNVLALNYKKMKRTWKCQGDGVDKTWVHRKIIHAGVHAEPNNPNWDPYTLGPSVLYEDGSQAWSHGAWRSALVPNQLSCDNKNKAFGYSVAATVFGTGISAQTDHSTMTAQCIKEGTSTHITHRVWGSNNWIWNHPQVFFSY